MSPTTRTLRQGSLRDWIAQGPAARLLAVLNADGGQARVVGGSVRNALLGEPLGDIDLATDLPPADVMARAKAAGFHAVPTGIDHGTVTVIIEGAPFEVTTLRSDVETHGRRATVKFGSDWKEDALRRDFTINALSISADGKVHDYVGGLDDLAHRRVRFIGDAQTRIREDYLRILRFFRFHACYGEGLPDPTGLHACIVARDGMARLSRERVRMELLKLLRAEHAVPVLAVMAESGLLTPILGGVPHLASLSNVMKAEGDLLFRPDSVRRLGALAVWIKEDADRLRERLRLTNDEYTRLVAMSEHWWRIGPSLGERRAKELLYRLGAEAYRDRVLIAWSRSQQGLADPAWRALAELPNRWTPIVFPIKAADFLARGLEKGPKLGAALRSAEEAWIDAGFPIEENLLKRIVDEVTASCSPG